MERIVTMKAVAKTTALDAEGKSMALTATIAILRHEAFAMHAPATHNEASTSDLRTELRLAIRWIRDTQTAIKDGSGNAATYAGLAMEHAEKAMEAAR